MTFRFSRYGLSPEEQRRQRFLEILPGATSWAILIGVTTLAFAAPLWAAILIIAFNLFWVMRLAYLTIFLVLSYFWLKAEETTDWLERIRHVDELDKYLDDPDNSEGDWTFGEWLSLGRHHRQLKALNKENHPPPPSSELFHVVLFPISKESRDVIEPGIQSLSGQTFSPKRVLVVFAVEERASEKIKSGVLSIAEKHKSAFADVRVIFHPDNIPGEARVKGANVTFAAKEIAQILTARKLSFERVLISCFDADTIVCPQYLACLTYYFLVTPQRLLASYQPIPVYHNNIWQVPGFARVIETGSSFFQLMEATNPEKLVTFSSHSMSFKALVEVDYWPVDMISDDSAIYWKALIHYEGNYRVVPMYITISMDIVGSKGWWATVKSVYKQKRRWAWGVENFPIVTRYFLRTQKISFYDKFRYGFKLFEGHVSWATWGFLLSFISWIPVIVAQAEHVHSVLSYNAPRIMGVIFNLAGLSLVVSTLLSISLLPKKPVTFPLLKKVRHVLEWMMIPFIMVFLSALPALDAQTRLMLGRTMEFWIADKRRMK